jgi:predicted dehydrogenase
VIGCGAISSVHFEAIRACPEAELYAVCDIDRERAEKTSEKYGCRYYTDYLEMLLDEEIDAVHICTPHYLHAPMAIAAMKAGKHVLCEKPMAIKALDAQEMIKVSEETGKQLGICFQNRCNTTSERIRELIDSGKLGAVLGGKAFVTWHRDEAYYASGEWRGSWEKEGGGVLINQSIHTLDLLQWFMGNPAKIKGSIDTRYLKDFIEVEDTAEAAILFKSGISGLFYATNGYCVDSPVSIELVCEKGLIRLDEELVIKYDDGKTEHMTNSDKATGKKAYWGSGHKALINDFYKSLAFGKKFAIGGREAIITLKLINGIYESGRTGKYSVIED